MSAGTYDPFALEKPTLKLGEHGEWVLGDITDTREAAMGEAIAKLHKVEEQDAVTNAQFADAVGAILEAACEDSEGLREKLVDLADEAKHGKKALGAKALRGASDFVFEWLLGEGSAGEG